ncbi:MAG: hypothetical protein IKZ19_05610 [Clostridia bacterium]|nr:hypothetical protein [Clostridia bacterium]
MAAVFPYEDIVNLPRHVSKKYPQASMSDRAARFSPFAAISGYEEMVLEVARTTEEKLVLSEDEIENINCCLKIIADRINEKPEARVTFFEPDGKKCGGEYFCVSGPVVNVDQFRREITVGEKCISFDNIAEMFSPLFLKETDEEDKNG